MSHQTGIQANDELKTYFSKCRNGKIRLLKVIIDNEQLSLGNCKPLDGSWDKDFDRFLTPVIEENNPCYILYRLDSKNSMGHDWILISWCPDTAPIRQKMLYASTKATLKQEFGTSLIKDEIHGTVLSDVTFNGYMKHLQTGGAPAPLTSREEELLEIKKSEINTDVHIDTKHQTLGGVLFPISDEAKNAIKQMSLGVYDYLQLKIDISEEKVHLVTAENLKLDEMISKVPSESARYHLFNFKHTHERDFLESIVFIYSMPGYNCSIKERMLYSSCKGPLTDTIISWGVNIAKKLEIDDPTELSEQYLYEELHPIKNLQKPKFSKPKGPPSRGPKRLTKTADQ
ncbi:PREDICTED: twinfilin [Nicrophorus vespilloides]|uniref:Twinfilin n=1 Tax=Nicrophorus vespilloides TaxID=110193 RepID=A0ABM1MDK1_NICVS|nr:PREDICTED: twinfilin [Nicrophorus vespilloides]